MKTRVRQRIRVLKCLEKRLRRGLAKRCGDRLAMHQRMLVKCRSFAGRPRDQEGLCSRRKRPESGCTRVGQSMEPQPFPWIPV